MPRCDPGTLLSLDGPGLWDVSASAAPGPADVFTTTLDGSFGPSTGDWLLYGGGSSGGGGGSSGGVEVGGDFVGSDALRADYGADFGGIGIGPIQPPCQPVACSHLEILWTTPTTRIMPMVSSHMIYDI